MMLRNSLALTPAHLWGAQAHAAGDTLACHNLVLVAASLLVAGAVDAGLLFSLLDHLMQRCAGACTPYA